MATVGCFGIGTLWLVNLVMDIYANPTSDGYMESKVRIDHVPFPALEIGKRTNLKMSKVNEMNE